MKTTQETRDYLRAVVTGGGRIAVAEILQLLDDVDAAAKVAAKVAEPESVATPEPITLADVLDATL